MFFFQKLLFLYGPTSSNKSKLSHYLFFQNVCFILNLDLKQMYKKIYILTFNCNNLSFKNFYCFFPLNTKFISFIWRYNFFNLCEILFRKIGVFLIIGGNGLYFYFLLHGIFIFYNFFALLKFFSYSLILSKNVLHKTLFTLFILFLFSDIRINYLEFLFNYIKIFILFSKWKYFRKQYLHSLFCFHIYIRPKKNIMRLNAIFRLKYMINLNVLHESFFLKLNYSLLILPRVIGLYSIFSYINRYITYNKMLFSLLNTTVSYSKKQYTWFDNKTHFNLKII